MLNDRLQIEYDSAKLYSWKKGKCILIYIHRSRVDQLEASSAFQPAKLGTDLLQLSMLESQRDSLPKL